MQFICLKNEINNILQIVQKFISSKPGKLPILSGIYLFAENDNFLTIQASNYEFAINTKIKANVEISGRAVVFGKFLIDILKKNPGDEISFKLIDENKKIRIKSNYSQFTLLTMQPEEFPIIKPFLSNNFLKIKSNELKNIIKKTTFACSQDEGRPLFTGCLLEIEKGKMNVVSTDTHRMAITTINSINSMDSVSIIIPSKIFNEIGRILSLVREQEVCISWQRNEISFSFGDVYIKSRLLDGKFPDYNNVVPNEYVLTAKINKNEIEGAVERVSLLSSGLYNIVKMSIAQNNITVSTNNPDIGMATEVVSADIIGKSIEITFNSRYILDILKHIESTEVTFKLSGENSAALIENVTDSNYKYVLTPIRTNQI